MSKTLASVALISGFLANTVSFERSSGPLVTAEQRDSKSAPVLLENSSC